MMNFDINSLIAAIIGLLGVILSIYFSYRINKQNHNFQKQLNKQNNLFQEELLKRTRKNELWDKKYDLLNKIVRSREDVTNEEFRKSMNSIQILFHDSPEVLKKIDEIYIESSKPINDSTRNVNEGLLDLFESMLKELDIASPKDRDRLFKVFKFNA